MGIPDHEHAYAWNKFDRLACEVCGKAQREVDLEQQFATLLARYNHQAEEYTHLLVKYSNILQFNTALEQQFAEVRASRNAVAQEGVEKLAAALEKHDEQLAQARALLEPIADMACEDQPDEPFYRCGFCGSRTQIPAEISHIPGCLGARVHAFLASLEASDGK